MTPDELQTKYDRLIDLVRRMRGRQKDYFKYRARPDLDASKNLERQVDNLLKSEVEKKESKQQELF